MAIAGCIVTSCLLTKRNSIATVSITRTNLVCGQMGILTRLCRVTCNYVALSVCGVEIWMISWLVPSSSKIARLTVEVYPRLLLELHQIWRTCPLINEVVYKYTSNMKQNLLIFGMLLEIYLTIICLADGSGVVVPTICQLRSRTQVYSIIMFGIKGINGLQREGWNARRIALSPCWMWQTAVRTGNKQLALFTAERRGALLLRVEFSKTCFKHTPV